MAIELSGIVPGQTKTFTADFSDQFGNTEPLGSLPTLVETTGGLTVTVVGTPTVNDKTFSWTVNCGTGANVGTAYNLVLTAEGDPTPGVNTITQTYDVHAIADEDSQVSVTFV